MFGAFSLDFLYWILFGISVVVVAAGLKVFIEDRGAAMTWWKWLTVGIWYVVFLVAYTAPFTIMGEGETGAGWRMLAFTMVIMLIVGVGVLRVLLIKGDGDAEETEDSTTDAAEQASASD